MVPWGVPPLSPIGEDNEFPILTRWVLFVKKAAIHLTTSKLKNNPAINLKKADKETTTVIMNKADKIFEAKVQLKNREHYERLKAPMVKTRQEHIDDMTN